MAQRQAERQQTLAIKASAAAAAEDAKMAQFRCGESASYLNLLQQTRFRTLDCRDAQLPSVGASCQLRPGAVCLTMPQVCRMRMGASNLQIAIFGVVDKHNLLAALQADCNLRHSSPR